MQIAALYLNMLSARVGDQRGDAVADVTQRDWPETFGGYPLHIGMNALPGRLDLFSPSTWYLGELLPLELYDFGGGITVAPVPDIVNGGYLTSSMFSYVASVNIANSNPRAGVYISSAAIPSV